MVTSLNILGHILQSNTLIDNSNGDYLNRQSPLYISKKKLFFRRTKTTTTIMFNITAVGYEDSLYVLKVLIPLRVRGLIVFVNEVEEFEKRPQKCVETGSVHFWCNFLGTKKVYKIENQIFVDYSLRRALDSNQRIPYDIGSLANCWFKPLTQPSLNHLFKRVVQIYDIFLIYANNRQNIRKYSEMAGLCCPNMPILRNISQK